MINVKDLNSHQAHEMGRLFAAEAALADGAPEVAVMILASTVYVTVRRSAAGSWQFGGWGKTATEGTAAVVFADLSGKSPRFTVVPSWWLRDEIEAMRAREYPDGHRPVNDDSEHVGIWPRQLTQWGADWRAAYTAGPADNVLDAAAS